VSRPFVAFHVTDRCARSCAHCLRDPGRAPRDLPVPLFERVLDEARRSHGLAHAGLTGGEPALHPELPALLDAVAARGMTFHVVSSGGAFARLLDALDGAAARREALELVDLSLDGATEAVHDAIRGAGSFREVNAAILACHARGIRFTVQMTVNARNEADVEAVGLAAAQLGAERVAFGATLPTGSPADSALFLPAERLAAVRDRVERLAGVLRLPVVAALGFPERQPLRSCPPFRGEILHVDVKGRLSLCCNHSGTPGPEQDAVADLATSSLVEAHLRLLELVHRLERGAVERLAAGPLAGFDLSPCNGCLARMGKPHWTDHGAAGPRALRERAPQSAPPGSSKKPA
jgi:MoaA/NifB/PqqE/SkfB family radical SAM enzyme